MNYHTLTGLKEYKCTASQSCELKAELDQWSSGFHKAEIKIVIGWALIRRVWVESPFKLTRAVGRIHFHVVVL